MVFRVRPGHAFNRAKQWAGQAYASAHELAPHVKKFAAGARRAYEAAAPMIDEYGGSRAGSIHGAARRGFDTYDQLERAALQGDSVIRAFGG